MATNKLKIQHFRANDLVDNGGKQFEMGKSWCQEFFEIDNSVEEITIHLTFKALNQPQQALDNSLIELKLSGVNIRGDRKAYANGENGQSQIKDFFINKLHLTTSNQSDYFALFKTNQTEYNLYYIPKLLYDNFIYLFINGVDVSCQECSPTERGSIYSLLDSYRPYITAIKSKPFLLLAGISGTGKSRIVRELARACWDVDSEEYKAHKPKNFEMVQVKPNWHDSSELIGYVSRIDGVRYVVGPFLKFMVKAIQDPNTPYFLCLDEMNLAPVEQYFAEFLSVVESRKVDKDGNVVTDPLVDYSSTEEYKSLIDQLFCDDAERKAYLTEVGGKRLTIPQNLIVVGTVNMDETTFSFSRKVLDRAMTIEMNKVDLMAGLTNRHENIGKIEFADIIGKAVEGVDVYAAHKGVCDKAITYLKSINAALDKTPFKVAYRTRNELLLYVVNNLSWKTDDELEDFVIARALDEITCMKILTRIEGDETKVSANFLDNLGNAIKSGLVEIDKDLLQANKSHKGDAYQPISLDKLDEMKERLKSGYTSFWG